MKKSLIFILILTALFLAMCVSCKTTQPAELPDEQIMERTKVARQNALDAGANELFTEDWQRAEGYYASLQWQFAAELYEDLYKRALLLKEQEGETEAEADNSEEIAYDAFRRGIAYLRSEDPDNAIEQFNIAIEQKPDFMLAYLNRGTAYANKGEFDSAMADYDHSASLESDFAVIYFNRGVTYEEKGDTDKAISDYNQAIKLNPGYAEAFNNRGNIYYNQEDYNRAISDYEAALKIDSSIATAKSNLEAARQMRGGR